MFADADMVVCHCASALCLSTRTRRSGRPTVETAVATACSQVTSGMSSGCARSNTPTRTASEDFCDDVRQGGTCSADLARLRGR